MVSECPSAASCPTCLLKNLPECFRRLGDLTLCQSRMDEEHQAGVTQLSCDRQALFGTPPRFREGFFQINLRAASLETRHTEGFDFFNDPVAIPSRRQIVRAHIGVILIGSCLAE